MPWIRQKRLDEMKAAADSLLTELEKLKKRTFLMDIDVAQRMITFTFHRDGKLHQIDAMLLWGNDIEKWKRELL